MRSYLIRRLLLVFPTLAMVALIVFLLVALLPGTAVDLMLAQMEWRYGESDILAMKEALGVNVPLHIQFVRWMGGILQGNLGNSLWSGQPVLGEILQALPISLELLIVAVITGLLVSLPIGIYSAIRAGSLGDYAGRTFAIGALAVPTFWLGTLVVIFPSIWWQWTPSLRYISITEDPVANLVQFLIPGIILGLLLSGTTMRMTRTMMLEVLRQDYIRTAWAKGLNERVVILRHALKNALIPVVTVVGLQFPIVVGTAVVVEQIFALPGLGRYLLDAISHRDYIVIAGVNMFVATGVLIINLFVDISYAYLDPRVQYK